MWKGSANLSSILPFSLRASFPGDCLLYIATTTLLASETVTSTGYHGVPVRIFILYSNTIISETQRVGEDCGLCFSDHLLAEHWPLIAPPTIFFFQTNDRQTEICLGINDVVPNIDQGHFCGLLRLWKKMTEELILHLVPANIGMPYLKEPTAWESETPSIYAKEKKTG